MKRFFTMKQAKYGDSHLITHNSTNLTIVTQHKGAGRVQAGHDQVGEVMPLSGLAAAGRPAVRKGDCQPQNPSLLHTVLTIPTRHAYITSTFNSESLTDLEALPCQLSGSQHSLQYFNHYFVIQL